MKFSIVISQNEKYQPPNYEYSIPNYPTIADFLKLSDPIIAKVKMVGFDENFLQQGKELLAQLTDDFKKGGYYVEFTVMEEALLEPGPPVYICIRMKG